LTPMTTSAATDQNRSPATNNSRDAYGRKTS
jgi:hypothetical protein